MNVTDMFIPARPVALSPMGWISGLGKPRMGRVKSELKVRLGLAARNEVRSRMK